MNKHMIVDGCLEEHKPAVYMPMLETAENVAPCANPVAFSNSRSSCSPARRRAR